MSDISAYAVESVTVRLAPSQMENGTRRQHIAGLLRAMEYPTKAIRFEASKETAARDAEMDIAYAVVVPPRCPDWRVSPVTSNSNTYRENFGCATTVNLGAQLADPRDLEKGSGKMPIDTPTAIQALKNYKSGESDGTAASGDSTTSITPAGGSAIVEG
jgi:pilus biogenesis lipoprotein CpaD